MYAMLGMAPERSFLSFGDINALIHPQDDALHCRRRNAGHLGNQCDRSHLPDPQRAKANGSGCASRGELVCDREDKATHLVGIAVDITEQKILAEQSATADIRLRDALETVSEAFVLWDDDNRLVMCNSKFQRFHNLPSEAIVARPALCGQ